MKKIFALILATILIVPSEANAYSIKTYKKFVLEYEAGIDLPNHEMNSLILNAYHQGIAETLDSILRLNNRVIMNQGERFICVPKNAIIDSNMIAVLMRQEIRDLSKYPKLFGDKWENTVAFQLVLTGLWRTFPCQDTLVTPNSEVKR